MGTSIASRRAGFAAAFVVAGIALFVGYLNQSWTALVSSDGASNALQAWDMLHGNPTLHGWSVSDVSFYTTELPEYMLVESIHGLGTGVTHICGALTYTLLVLMVALAARGRATGWPGAVRALLGAGLMLAPQLGVATETLLLSPDHIGTGVPLLLTFFVLDWGENLNPRRWYVPVAVGVLLAWTAIGDPLALVIGVLPLALVSCLRAARRQDLRYELWLLSAAVSALVAQTAVTKFVGLIGGWKISGVQTGVAGTGTLGRNLHFTLAGVLQLFGADFSARPQGQAALFAVLHLAGVLALLGALYLAVRHFLSAERLVQVLTVAIAVNLVAYALGVQVRDAHSAREIAVVLPFGAVLTGRLLGDRLGRGIAMAPAMARIAGKSGAGGSRWRQRAPLAVVAGAVVAMAGLLGSYGGMLASSAVQPSVQPENTDLVAWLESHGLKGGIGGYWQANSTTLDTGGVISVRAISIAGGTLSSGGDWEAESSWYDPSKHYANFVVAVKAPHYESDLGLIWAVAARTGYPWHIYRFGRYTVAVWRHNVMRAIGAPLLHPNLDESSGLSECGLRVVTPGRYCQ